MTFSDALMAVRRWLGREWAFPEAGVAPVVEKLPGPVQDLLFYGLAMYAGYRFSFRQISEAEILANAAK